MKRILWVVFLFFVLCFSAHYCHARSYGGWQFEQLKKNGSQALSYGEWQFEQLKKNRSQALSYGAWQFEELTKNTLSKVESQNQTQKQNKPVITISAAEAEQRIHSFREQSYSYHNNETDFSKRIALEKNMLEKRIKDSEWESGKGTTRYSRAIKDDIRMLEENPEQYFYEKNDKRDRYHHHD
jgi:hypothetical protein